MKSIIVPLIASLILITTTWMLNSGINEAGKINPPMLSLEAGMLALIAAVLLGFFVLLSGIYVELKRANDLREKAISLK